MLLQQAKENEEQFRNMADSMPQLAWMAKTDGTNTDIDDQGRAGDELKWAVSTRDEFLSIASHELKTPLTSLKMQIQMTQRNVSPSEGRAPTPEKLAKVLNMQAIQVERLTSLVEELLDFSKIQAVKLTYNYEKLDLTALV